MRFFATPMMRIEGRSHLMAFFAVFVIKAWANRAESVADRIFSHFQEFETTSLLSGMNFSPQRKRSRHEGEKTRSEDRRGGLGLVGKPLPDWTCIHAVLV